MIFIEDFNINLKLINLGLYVRRLGLLRASLIEIQAIICELTVLFWMLDIQTTVSHVTVRLKSSTALIFLK